MGREYKKELSRQVCQVYEGLEDVLSMTKQELEKIEHTPMKWQCCAEGCTRYTTVQDYGVAPAYYWASRKDWIFAHGEVYYCGKHWPLYKKYENSIQYKQEPIESFVI